MSIIKLPSHLIHEHASIQEILSKNLNYLYHLLSTSQDDFRTYLNKFIEMLEFVNFYESNHSLLTDLIFQELIERELADFMSYYYENEIRRLRGYFDFNRAIKVHTGVKILPKLLFHKKIEFKINKHFNEKLKAIIYMNQRVWIYNYETERTVLNTTDKNHSSTIEGYSVDTLSTEIPASETELKKSFERTKNNFLSNYVEQQRFLPNKRNNSEVIGFGDNSSVLDSHKDEIGVLEHTRNSKQSIFSHFQESKEINLDDMLIYASSDNILSSKSDEEDDLRENVNRKIFSKNMSPDQILKVHELMRKILLNMQNTEAFKKTKSEYYNFLLMGLFKEHFVTFDEIFIVFDRLILCLNDFIIVFKFEGDYENPVWRVQEIYKQNNMVSPDCFAHIQSLSEAMCILQNFTAFKNSLQAYELFKKISLEKNFLSIEGDFKSFNVCVLEEYNLICKIVDYEVRYKILFKDNSYYLEVDFFSGFENFINRSIQDRMSRFMCKGMGISDYDLHSYEIQEVMSFDYQEGVQIFDKQIDIKNINEEFLSMIIHKSLFSSIIYDFVSESMEINPKFHNELENLILKDNMTHDSNKLILQGINSQKLVKENGFIDNYGGKSFDSVDCINKEKIMKENEYSNNRLHDQKLNDIHENHGNINSEEILNFADCLSKSKFNEVQENESVNYMDHEVFKQNTSIFKTKNIDLLKEILENKHNNISELEDRIMTLREENENISHSKEICKHNNSQGNDGLLIVNDSITHLKKINKCNNSKDNDGLLIVNDDISRIKEINKCNTSKDNDGLLIVNDDISHIKEISKHNTSNDDDGLLIVNDSITHSKEINKCNNSKDNDGLLIVNDSITHLKEINKCNNSKDNDGLLIVNDDISHIKEINKCNNNKDQYEFKNEAKEYENDGLYNNQNSTEPLMVLENYDVNKFGIHNFMIKSCNSFYLTSFESFTGNKVTFRVFSGSFQTIEAYDYIPVLNTSLSPNYIDITEKDVNISLFVMSLKDFRLFLHVHHKILMNFYHLKFFSNIKVQNSFVSFKYEQFGIYFSCKFESLKIENKIVLNIILKNKNIQKKMNMGNITIRSVKNIKAYLDFITIGKLFEFKNIQVKVTRNQIESQDFVFKFSKVLKFESVNDYLTQIYVYSCNYDVMKMGVFISFFNLFMRQRILFDYLNLENLSLEVICSRILGQNLFIEFKNNKYILRTNNEYKEIMMGVDLIFITKKLFYFNRFLDIYCLFKNKIKTSKIFCGPLEYIIHNFVAVNANIQVEERKQLLYQLVKTSSPIYFTVESERFNAKITFLEDINIQILNCNKENMEDVIRLKLQGILNNNMNIQNFFDYFNSLNK